jgi:hypothetical protein
MGVKVKGIQQAKANLNRIIDDIQGEKLFAEFSLPCSSLAPGGDLYS